jgi:hypothetical protein
LNQNPKKTQSEAFDATNQKAGHVFFNALADKIKEALEVPKKESFVICLDKNHPPSALPRTIDTINKVASSYSNKSYKLLKIAMIPEMVQTLNDYPFSLSFLF